jgi:hypothetical protein
VFIMRDRKQRESQATRRGHEDSTVLSISRRGHDNRSLRSFLTEVDLFARDRRRRGTREYA